MVGGIDGLHTFRECSDYLHRAVIVRVKIESGEATREAHRELTSHSFLALVSCLCTNTTHTPFPPVGSYQRGWRGASESRVHLADSAGALYGTEVTPDASHV